jgi:hypothetical protein
MNINKSCDALYGGKVYLQSYTLLIVTTMLNVSFEAFCVHILLPFLIDILGYLRLFLKKQFPSLYRCLCCAKINSDEDTAPVQSEEGTKPSPKIDPIHAEEIKDHLKPAVRTDDIELGVTKVSSLTNNETFDENSLDDDVNENQNIFPPEATNQSQHDLENLNEPNEIKEAEIVPSSSHEKDLPKEGPNEPEDDFDYDHLFEGGITSDFMKLRLKSSFLRPIMDLIKSDKEEYEPTESHKSIKMRPEEKLLVKTANGIISVPLEESLQQLDKQNPRSYLERAVMYFFQGDDSEYLKSPSSVDMASMIYNFLQSCYILYIVVITFSYTSNSTVTGSWDRYQVFYGILNNTALMLSVSRSLRFSIYKTCEIDFEKWHRSGRWLLREIDWLDKLLSRLIPIILIFPPFITHVFPALFVYYWIALLCVVCLIASYYLSIYGIVYAWVLICYCTGINPRYRKHIPRTIAVSTKYFLRLYLVFVYQTLFNYMYLFYAANGSSGGIISGSDYLGVISDEFHYRSQTYCLVNKYLDNAINFVSVFNWL